MFCCNVVWFICLMWWDKVWIFYYFVVNVDYFVLNFCFVMESYLLLVLVVFDVLVEFLWMELEIELFLVDIFLEELFLFVVVVWDIEKLLFCWLVRFFMKFFCKFFIICWMEVLWVRFKSLKFLEWDLIWLGNLC